MIERHLKPLLATALGSNPAVVLLGPRQSGKTTLAQEITKTRDSIYLDLETTSDRNRLTDAQAYLEAHENHLVILDEVQRFPDLFQELRGLIDRGRRRGLKAGRFLLLGSASLELLRQSGESLAGRVSYLELTPIHAAEWPAADSELLWLRGGFPESLLARTHTASLRWRHDFIRSYLERDIPQLGPRIAAETLRRFWTMLAHHQGGLLNAASLARSLGVDGKTVAAYMDLMVDLLLVRRLQPWHRNAGKRLIKAPKIYVRDSGLTHALLGIADPEALLAHPVAGGSWEGFVIESLLAVAPLGTEAYFYRTSGGAEIDLLLKLPDGKIWAIEIKRSSAPTLDRGFHHACGDLAPQRRYVVYQGTERYPLQKDVEAIPLRFLTKALAAA
ncbi:MAG: ATP-binding protein [Pseudomonadota bacterium]